MGTFIISVLILASVGSGAYYFARGGRSAESREWVEDSVKAWRSNELATDNFDVQVKDTGLDDLFTTFDHDSGDPYYSPDDIESRITDVTKSEIPAKVIDSTELVVLRTMEKIQQAKENRKVRKAEERKSGAEKSGADQPSPSRTKVKPPKSQSGAAKPKRVRRKDEDTTA